MVSTPNQPNRRPVWQAFATVALVAISALGWFDYPTNAIHAQLAFVNTADCTYQQDGTAAEAGTVSLPLTVRVALAAEAAAIEQAYLIYRVGAANYELSPIKWHTGVGNVTYIESIAFTDAQTSFGHDRLTTAHVALGASAILGLYASDGIYESMDPTAEIDAEGANGNGADWQIVSFTAHATNSKPGRPILDMAGHPVSVPPGIAAYDGYLVAYWDMDEASGNRADSSGNGYTLIDNATVTSRAGINGLAADFNVSSEFLDIADNADLSPSDTMAISAWVYRDTWVTPSDQEFVCTKGSSFAIVSHSHAIGLKSWQLWVNQSDSSLKLAASYDAVTSGAWVHVVGIADGTTVYIYINGVEGAVTAAYDGTIIDNASAFEVGKSFTSNFDGAIDESALWNGITFTGAAARQAFVDALYNAGTGRFYDGANWTP